MRHLVAFACGALFALGLIVSGMTDPAKVIGFLDFAGAWDPALMLVMGAALAVDVPLFRLILRRGRPVLSASFDLPKRNDLDPRLLAGAAVFGIGWGYAGFCPGPALVSLATLSAQPLAVTAGMLVGVTLVEWLRATRSYTLAPHPPVPTDG